MRHRLAALAAPLVLTGMLIGPGPAAASAAPCVSWTGGQAVSPSAEENVLFGVAVLSPCNAWAVGFDRVSGVSQALIEHWDGTSWKVVPSISPGTSGNSLGSVQAISARNIWAVGDFFNGTSIGALIEHWNGSAWKQVPAADLGTVSNLLTSVRAVSASNIWAVGASISGSAENSLIEHWDGTAWKQEHIPSGTGGSFLSGVAATSARNAWAVGQVDGVAGSASKTVILHWNGTRWKRMASPRLGAAGILDGVGATSAKSVWAVGVTAISSGGRTLILHWNGARWKRVASPNGGRSADVNVLESVTAPVADSAWAVGRLVSSSGPQETLILHWNGTRWAHVPSPSPGTKTNDLFGVGASSARNVWAVGAFVSGGPRQALAVRCC